MGIAIDSFGIPGSRSISLFMPASSPDVYMGSMQISPPYHHWYVPITVLYKYLRKSWKLNKSLRDFEFAEGCLSIIVLAVFIGSVPFFFR